MNASHTTLEDLTITPTVFLREISKARPHYPNATDLMPLGMQKLRNMTLRIWWKLPHNYPACSYLDDAVEILDMVSASPLASLNVIFSSYVLAEFADNLPRISENTSLKRFEESVARFAARQTAVSFFPENGRKNRGVFWTPILARAFPMLYGQGKLRQASRYTFCPLLGPQC